MTGDRRPLLLIANPSSGGKPGAPAPLDADEDQLKPEALRDALVERGLRVELHVLGEGDDVRDLARSAVERGCDVVVAGGDGTVAPAADAVRETDATLGILATGSYNNIARGTGVPATLQAALDAIAGGEVTVIDVGLAWHPGPDERPDADPPQDATAFFEAAGVGLDAAAFGVVQVHERYGLWRATRTAWRALRRRRTPLRLVIDGVTVRTLSPAVTVCNGPYHGAGFALAPDADPTDGLLDLVVFRRMSRLDVIGHFVSVARRRPRREPRVRVRRVRRVVIAGARRVLPAHADGVSLGTTPITIAVRPAALRVFTAPRRG
ncbi:MAG TPA: diacylglycerol kinase family protein [candidate division Zixibacteria bacterium]|nr:diacylglycerol kinase family protein [candidate division Zixibacteria bacterium]